MGQSLVKNYLHIIFSTKNRQCLIFPPFETELHSYLGGICKRMECHPLKIGGFNDHIHILCLLSKNIALADFIEELKSNSSKWMKSKDQSLQNFYWQDGYGAFSVSPKQTEAVIEYINNQHEHHKVQSFQNEFRSFLKKYEEKYDENFVWG